MSELTTISLCSADGQAQYKTFDGSINITPTINGGTGAVFNVNQLGSYPSFTINADLVSGGSGYYTDQIISIYIEPNVPQLMLHVKTVNETTGAILTFVNDSVITYAQFTTPNYTLTHILNGTGASLTITMNNSKYNVTVNSGGSGYSIGETLKITGDLLNGYASKNDLLVDIGQVGSGNVLGLSSVTGTPFKTSFQRTSSPRRIALKQGTGCMIDVFTLEHVNHFNFILAGSGYSIGNILTIPAGSFDDNGSMLITDLFFTVGIVNSQGAIQTGALYNRIYSGTEVNLNFSRITNFKPKIVNYFSEFSAPLIMDTLKLNPDTYNYYNTRCEEQIYYNSGDILHISGNQLGGTNYNDLMCMVGNFRSTELIVRDGTGDKSATVLPIIKGTPYMAQRIWRGCNTY